MNLPLHPIRHDDFLLSFTKFPDIHLPTPTTTTPTPMSQRSIFIRGTGLQDQGGSTEGQLQGLMQTPRSLREVVLQDGQGN